MMAADNPSKLEELKALFLAEAKKYQVLPLDASVATRLVMPRPNITAGRSEFVYKRPLTGIPQGNSPLLSTHPTPSRPTSRSRRGVPRAYCLPQEDVLEAMVFIF